MGNKNRLTSEQIQGIWAGVTMCWDDADRFDEKNYIANVHRAIAAKVHGIYTTGSTGEFYALGTDEFRRMVDIQAELCGAAGMPLQIGCCSDVTRKTIGLLEYAASKREVGAAQVVLPYWMELSDREVIQFFKDIHAACPELPLVHYNIPRAKRFLSLSHYQRILEVAPSLVGVKFTHTGQYFGQLADCIAATPALSYFVGETLLVSAMQIGARGCYSSLILTNPQFMLKLYEMARSGEWEAALRMQRRAADFLNGVESYAESLSEGMSDPVFDKGLSLAAGCIGGEPFCRAPYIGWTEKSVQSVRTWIEQKFPEFLFGSAI